MKIKILIPIFNDWQSVLKLLNAIDHNISDLSHEFSVIIVNDASTHDRPEEQKDFTNIRSIKILNMKVNQGHARSIATGLKYIFEKEEFDYIIPMDGDGEDRPEEIKQFIEKSLEEECIKYKELLVYSSPTRLMVFINNLAEKIKIKAKR